MHELHDAYERELAYMRELAREFARAHPEVAGRLDLGQHRGEDPHVERLIQAFCLIAARIHHRLDGDQHEVLQALVGMVYPAYLQPVPPATIAQFRLDPAQAASSGARAGLLVGAGHQVALSDECEFRTAYPVALWPVEVVAARLLDAGDVPVWGVPWRPSGAILLRLETGVPGGFAALDGLQSLRFCLRGATHAPFTLYEYLFNHCRGILVVDPDAPTTPPLAASRDTLVPVGYEASECLTGTACGRYHAFRLLQEYLAFPEKYLFFDLAGLDRCRAHVGAARRLEVLFLLDDRCPKDDRFRRLVVSTTRDSFQLGCAPAVNLLERWAEPIRLDHRRTEHLIEPDVYHPERFEVFSVDGVDATEVGSRRTRRYVPLFGAGRHTELATPPAGYWHAVRRAATRQDDDGTDVFLSLAESDRRLTDATVAVRLTCTNRDLPSRLDVGFAFDALPGGDNRLQYRLLQRPTRPARPPLDQRLDWKLVGHLGLNYLGLTGDDPTSGAEAVRELLLLHDFSASAANRSRIAALRAVDGTPARARLSFRRGAEVVPVFCHGLSVRIDLNADALASTGAFLFAAVLERFFASYSSLNSFTQLTATLDGKRREIGQWPPRAGTRPLL